MFAQILWKLLCVFYHRISAGVLFYAVLPLGGVTADATNRINKMIQKAGSLIAL